MIITASVTVFLAEVGLIALRTTLRMSYLMLNPCMKSAPTMRLRSEDVAKILARKGYSDVTVVARIPDPIPQPDAGEDPLGENEDEAGSSPRITVRIERRGAKLLDKDNLYGSVKYLCDALRYAKIIPDDDPEAIDLIVTQKRVKRPYRGTLVEIQAQ